MSLEHVDDFIDNPIPLQKFESDEAREGVRYAKFVLQLMRSSAALFHDIERLVPKLYCDICVNGKSKRGRVEFVSRMGWLRVCVGNVAYAVTIRDCSKWGAEP